MCATVRCSLQTTCKNFKCTAHTCMTTSYRTLHLTQGKLNFDFSGHSPKGLCFPGIFSRMVWSSAGLQCPKRWASCRERQRSLCWSPEVEHRVGVTAVHDDDDDEMTRNVFIQVHVQRSSLDSLPCNLLIYQMETFSVTKLLSFSASEVV